MDGGTIGIKSTGASCYYNAIFQLIFRTPELRNSINDAMNETYIDESDKKWLDGSRKFFTAMDESSASGTVCSFMKDKPNDYFDINEPLNEQGDSKDLLGKIITAVAHGSVINEVFNTLTKEDTVASHLPNAIRFELEPDIGFDTVASDFNIPTLFNDTYNTNLLLTYTNNSGAYMKPYADIHIFDGETCVKTDIISISDKLKEELPTNIPRILTVHVNRSMNTKVDSNLSESIETINKQLPSIGGKLNNNETLFKLIRAHFDKNSDSKYINDNDIKHFINSLDAKDDTKWQQYKIPVERVETDEIDANKVKAQYYIIFNDDDTIANDELNTRCKELLEYTGNGDANISGIIDKLIISPGKIDLRKELEKLRQQMPATSRKCMTKVDFDSNQTLEISNSTYELFAICMNNTSPEGNGDNLHPYNKNEESNNWITHGKLGGHWTLLFKDNKNEWTYYDDDIVEPVSNINAKYNDMHTSGFTANIMAYRRNTVDGPSPPVPPSPPLDSPPDSPPDLSTTPPLKKAVKKPSKQFTCEANAQEFTFGERKITFDEFAEHYGIQLKPPKKDLTSKPD
jgi:hypothetical protein